ncbi:CPBP family glutamic-type intramembrane protease [Sporosarcina jiandibaonis]|uniref:CPBP family glutamic-type intramembrane protease n=1 Tax=Sporosarcina jiandibaonis TaxID=2715535 RepID=UPI003CCDDE09
MHFPIWFYKGVFEFPIILSSIITAFVLGIIFGFIYKESNSLWSVIIVHSLYNLLVSLFY